MKIGVLALQGDFDAHRRRLEELGAEVVLVKKPEQLDAIDGLVIPGGESGTFLKLLGEKGFEKLKQFVRLKPTFGTCAGAILLATEVENPKQSGLGALDITIRRNAYGRQLDSSIREGKLLQLDRKSRRTISTEQIKTETRKGKTPPSKWSSSALQKSSASAPTSKVLATEGANSGRRPAGKSHGRHVPSRTLRRHPRPPGIPRPGRIVWVGHSCPSFLTSGSDFDLIAAPQDRRAKRLPAL